jgi:hypothetical protein
VALWLTTFSLKTASIGAFSTHITAGGGNFHSKIVDELMSINILPSNSMNKLWNAPQKLIHEL